MTDYTRRNFMRRTFTLASGLAVASVIPGINPLERIAMASDSDITVGASPEEMQRTIDRINYHREQAFKQFSRKDLDWVSAQGEFDPEFTDACNNHAKYLAYNYEYLFPAGLSEKDRLARMHDEDPDLFFYTPEGQEAAKISGVHWMPSPSKSVDGFIETFYHRIPFINPRKIRYGIGFAKNKNITASVIGSRDKGYFSLPILYPAPNQENVPVSWDGREVPSPIPEEERPIKDHKIISAVGYTITATFSSVKSTSDIYSDLRDFQASLLDTEKYLNMKTGLKEKRVDIKEDSELWWRIIKDYAEVPCYFSSPEKPANPIIPNNSNSICLIPKKPLEHNIDYTAFMRGTFLKDKEWKQTWSFKTIPKETRTEPGQIKK